MTSPSRLHQSSSNIYGTRIVGCTIQTTSARRRVKLVQLSRSTQSTSNVNASQADVQPRKRRYQEPKASQEVAVVSEPASVPSASAQGSQSDSQAMPVAVPIAKPLMILLALSLALASQSILATPLVARESPVKANMSQTHEDSDSEIEWRYTSTGWQHVDDLQKRSAVDQQPESHSLHPALFAALLVLSTLWALVAFSPDEIWDEPARSPKAHQASQQQPTERHVKKL